MVWQDGETIVGNLDLLRLRLQIVSDNLVHKKLIPPMVHVLIAREAVEKPKAHACAASSTTPSPTATANICWTKFFPKSRRRTSSAPTHTRERLQAHPPERSARSTSPGIDPINSAVSCHTSAATFPCNGNPNSIWTAGTSCRTSVRREPRKNLRIWLSDGADDKEGNGGSWPLNNILLANSLKLKGYDFHFRFGEGMHAIAQGAMDLPESLTWLWRDYDASKTAQTYEIEDSERTKPVFRVKIANRDAW